MRLIDADALKEDFLSKGDFISAEIIDNATTISAMDIAVVGYEAAFKNLTETDIQKVLNKYCMTAVANEYLIALHNKNGTPKGKWLPRLHASENDIYICSCCAKELGYDPNFCPNCGAYMRGAE